MDVKNVHAYMATQRINLESHFICSLKISAQKTSADRQYRALTYQFVCCATAKCNHTIMLTSNKEKTLQQKCIVLFILFSIHPLTLPSFIFLSNCLLDFLFEDVQLLFCITICCARKWLLLHFNNKQQLETNTHEGHTRTHYTCVGSQQKIQSIFHFEMIFQKTCGTLSTNAFRAHHKQITHDSL